MEVYVVKYYYVDIITYDYLFFQKYIKLMSRILLQLIYFLTERKSKKRIGNKQPKLWSELLQRQDKSNNVPYKLETYLKIARLYLEIEDDVQSETYVNRAAQLIPQTKESTNCED